MVSWFISIAQFNLRVAACAFALTPTGNLSTIPRIFTTDSPSFSLVWFHDDQTNASQFPDLHRRIDRVVLRLSISGIHQARFFQARVLETGQ